MGFEKLIYIIKAIKKNILENNNNFNDCFNL